MKKNATIGRDHVERASPAIEVAKVRPLGSTQDACKRGCTGFPAQPHNGSDSLPLVATWAACQANAYWGTNASSP